MRGDVTVRDVTVSSAGEWVVCNTVKDLSDEQQVGGSHRCDHPVTRDVHLSFVCDIAVTESNVAYLDCCNTPRHKTTHT
jgi:hypothetical protein